MNTRAERHDIPATTRGKTDNRKQWTAWLTSFGGAALFDSMEQIIQGAQSRCVHCGQEIELDFVEGGGVPAWKTPDGDYGCLDSPETGEEGTGCHVAVGTQA